MNAELPLGLGLALAQNEVAMHRFGCLSEAEKQATLRQGYNARSKVEMRRLAFCLLTCKSDNSTDE